MTEENTAMVRIHYDGDLIENHQIPMRILGLCATHIQRAIDRAYLDTKYDGVWKHARMKNDDYIETEFFAQSPEEGGYILDFIAKGKRKAKEAIDKVSDAIAEVINAGGEDSGNIPNQIKSRKEQLIHGILKPIEFESILDGRSDHIKRRYGHRSIAKEIDQVLSTIRKEYAGDSTFEISLSGSSTKSFDFNRHSSQIFHTTVSKKGLFLPVEYSGVLQVLDKKNKQAKFINSSNNRLTTLHIQDEDDFLVVHPFLADDTPMNFIGCPLLEFGALEPNSGDVYFLQLIENDDFGDHEPPTEPPVFPSTDFL